MNNTKTYLVAGAIALVIAGGTAWFLRSPSTSTTTYIDKNGETKVGAIASPEIPFNYINLGGVKVYTAMMAIAATSSVPCSLPNPTNQFTNTSFGLGTSTGATTTPIYFGMRVDTNGMGAQVLTIATSTTPYATSTPGFVRGRTLSTGPDSVVWMPFSSTTNQNIIGTNPNGTGETDTIQRGNEYTNFKIATGTAGTFANYLTGQCVGLWVVNN